MKERDAWSSILRGALTKAVALREAPVPGARLRSFVGREAEAEGRTFPPEPGMKLGNFLLLFPDIVLVLQREGMDLLAVPAERPDLLLSGREDAFIRKDFFDAFTRVVATQRPWYVIENDDVIWLEAAADIGSDLIPMPGTTLEREIEARRDFAAQVAEQGTRNVLLSAIEQTLPLKRFSEAVHASGLQTSWRKARTLSVLQQMQSWTAENQLAWQPSWFRVPGAPKQTVQNAVAPLASVPALSTDLARRDLAHAFTRLSDDDLTRIMVPMDIVLKLLERR